MTNYTITKSIEIVTYSGDVYFPVHNGSRLKSYSGNSETDVINNLQSGGFDVKRIDPEPENSIRRKYRDTFKKSLTDITDNYPIYNSRVKFYIDNFPDPELPEPIYTDRYSVIRHLLDGEPLYFGIES